jgi:hypothetical protein
MDTGTLSCIAMPRTENDESAVTSESPNHRTSICYAIERISMIRVANACDARSMLNNHQGSVVSCWRQSGGEWQVHCDKCKAIRRANDKATERCVRAQDLTTDLTMLH